MSRDLFTLVLLALTLIAGIGFYPTFSVADNAAVSEDDSEADEIIVGDTDEDGEMADGEEPEELGEE